MGKKRDVSIKDIAAHCGISVATVSRVLNNKGNYTPETRDKVLRAVDSLNYSVTQAPHHIHRTKLIGILVPDAQNEWFSVLIVHLETAFGKKGYRCLICHTNHEKSAELELCHYLIDAGICGLINIACTTSDIITLTAANNIPMVCIDRPPSDSLDQVACVESDHFLGAFIATELLIKRGCNRILFLGRFKESPINEPRLNGYLAALKQYGKPEASELIVNLQMDEYPNFSSTKNMVYYLIKSSVKFDGIFAVNDWRAFGALAALQMADIQIPNEVKLIGFDDVSLTRFCTPAISTIHQDDRLIAQTAADILLDAIEQCKLPDPCHIVIPIAIVERGTT